jgi:23S rRNA (guanosine2251-2'-O)-methyltransferase
VAGRRPVEEAFVARRKAQRLLVTPQRRQALEKIVLHATSLRIPIVEVEGGTLTAITGFDGHQGVALVVEARRYATPDEILARAIERGEPPFMLVLDSLEDPQNVGTLLRSAEAAGVHGVLFPTKRQAPLSPAAVKASAGAVEHLLLAPVDDLAGALVDLHIRGLRVVGAEVDAPLTARQADLRGPLALVVGSEGQGLGPTVRRRTDLMVRIPMRGAIGSLNASVAGSILLFEALAQRDPDGTSTRPAVATDPTAASGAATSPATQATPKVAKIAKGLATGLAPVAATEKVKAPKASKPTTATKATKAPTSWPAASTVKPEVIPLKTPTTAKATTAKTAKATAAKAVKAPTAKPAKGPTAKATTAKAPAAKAPAAKAAKATTAKAPAAKAKAASKPRRVTSEVGDSADDGLLPGGPRPG